MKLKKLLGIVAVIVLAFSFSLSLYTPARANASTIVDELGADTTATLYNLADPVDATGENYYGVGGDTTIRGIKEEGAKVSMGYAEYSVTNATKVSANFYFPDMNGNKPYLELDTKGSNAWSAWGDPNASLAPTAAQGAGNDIVFKYVDVETGLMYVKVNGYWFVYCDEVNAVNTGWWSWLRIHDGVSYPKPDESKLVPVGGGFQYTEDGTTWKWLNPTITAKNPVAGTNKTWETWEANIPSTAVKVRIVLTNRAVYATVFNPMTEVVPHFETRATGCSNWYMFMGKITIEGEKPEQIEQETLTITSAAEHVYGSEYTLAVTGGSGDGEVTYEMITEGTTGEGTLNGNVLTVTKAGVFKFKATKAASGNYLVAESEVFTLTVNKANQTGTLTVEDITEGETLVVMAEGATLYYKVKDADDATYTETVPTEVGEYTVKAVFAGNDNYNELVLTEDFSILEDTSTPEQPGGSDSEQPSTSDTEEPTTSESSTVAPAMGCLASVSGTLALIPVLAIAVAFIRRKRD